MNAGPVRFERRPMQRFALHLPVSVRLTGASSESCGYTQDISARGILFYTDLALAPADAVELSFMMPSEITLADAMRVRCRGKVIRIAPPSGGTAHGIAVRIEGYEFLPEPESLPQGSKNFPTVAIPVTAARPQKGDPSADSVQSVAPVLP